MTKNATGEEKKYEDWPEIFKIVTESAAKIRHSVCNRRVGGGGVLDLGCLSLQPTHDF